MNECNKLIVLPVCYYQHHLMRRILNKFGFIIVFFLILNTYQVRIEKKYISIYRLIKTILYVVFKLLTCFKSHKLVGYLFYLPKSKVGRYLSNCTHTFQTDLKQFPLTVIYSLFSTLRTNHLTVNFQQTTPSVDCASDRN